MPSISGTCTANLGPVPCLTQNNNLSYTCSEQGYDRMSNVSKYDSAEAACQAGQNYTGRVPLSGCGPHSRLCVDANGRPIVLGGTTVTGGTGGTAVTGGTTVTGGNEGTVIGGNGEWTGGNGGGNGGGTGGWTGGWNRGGSWLDRVTIKKLPVNALGWITFILSIIGVIFLVVSILAGIWLYFLTIYKTATTTKLQFPKFINILLAFFASPVMTIRLLNNV
jgi:hypothetical protein